LAQSHNACIGQADLVELWDAERNGRQGRRERQVSGTIAERSSAKPTGRARISAKGNETYKLDHEHEAEQRHQPAVNLANEALVLLRRELDSADIGRNEGCLVGNVLDTRHIVVLVSRDRLLEIVSVDEIALGLGRSHGELQRKRAKEKGRRRKRRAEVTAGNYREREREV
jgi:hypothetical protein